MPHSECNIVAHVLPVWCVQQCVCTTLGVYREHKGSLLACVCTAPSITHTHTRARLHIQSPCLYGEFT